MTEREYIAQLGDWQGFTVGTVGRLNFEASGMGQEIWVELRPEKDRAMECSGCGQEVGKVHEYCERWVDDLSAWGAKTRLKVSLRRVKCPRCGTRMEKVAWLDSYMRVTKRLAHSIALMCDILPISEVAQQYGQAWHSVKKIHKQWLRETLGSPDFTGVTAIGFDEFAIQKGHRYATVIIDAQTRRVLWVGRGRKREDIRPFFELLGPEGCGRIQAAVMDMWEAFEVETRAHCPNVEIVYDLFHVVSNYGREVVDQVRTEEVARVENDPKARKVIKGSKWLLLRNKENVRPQDRVKLKELLAANSRLATVYILKDDLKHLWDYTYQGAAQRFWDEWYNKAMRSKIETLKKFARKLKERLPGIFSHCRHPYNTSVIEGINNKIKVIKRTAYGYRDDEYFFLKIRRAFPGI